MAQEMLGEPWSDYLRLVAERPWEFEQSPSLEIILDEDAVAEFTRTSSVAIGVVYKSRYNMMVVDLVRGEDGTLFPYERLIPTSTGRSVVAVPLCQGRLVLIEQFRHATRSLQLAFPRGYGEDALGAEENARKELSEEIGAEVASAQPIGKVIANSGISGDSAEVVLCEVNRYEARLGHEGIRGHAALSPDELTAKIADGGIVDGFTLAAWSLVKARGIL